MSAGFIERNPKGNSRHNPSLQPNTSTSSKQRFQLFAALVVCSQFPGSGLKFLDHLLCQRVMEKLRSCMKATRSIEICNSPAGGFATSISQLLCPGAFARQIPEIGFRSLQYQHDGNGTQQCCSENGQSPALEVNVKVSQPCVQDSSSIACGGGTQWYIGNVQNALSIGVSQLYTMMWFQHADTRPK